MGGSSGSATTGVLVELDFGLSCQFEFGGGILEFFEELFRGGAAFGDFGGAELIAEGGEGGVCGAAEGGRGGGGLGAMVGAHGSGRFLDWGLLRGFCLVNVARGIPRYRL